MQNTHAKGVNTMVGGGQTKKINEKVYCQMWVRSKRVNCQMAVITIRGNKEEHTQKHKNNGVSATKK